MLYDLSIGVALLFLLGLLFRFLHSRITTTQEEVKTVGEKLNAAMKDCFTPDDFQQVHAACRNELCQKIDGVKLAVERMDKKIDDMDEKREQAKMSFLKMQGINGERFVKIEITLNRIDKFMESHTQVQL